MKWHIRFKIIDKKARAKKEKYVVSNVDAVVNPGLENYIFAGIMGEIKRLKAEGLLK